MGKAKKPKLAKHAAKPYSKDQKRAAGSASKPSASQAKRASGAKPKPAAAPSRPADLPFKPTDRILLVGEGDFSFAASLATHHGCTSVTATSPEPTRAAALSKHPQAEGHLSALERAGCAVHWAVDATKLGAAGVAGGSALRKAAPFDAVAFNFPHVGGRSTDVNRQVRANQALVVGFLQASLRMLAAGGAVVVSLFEGQPYELWGLRNLARHVGLRVERSMRFEARLFPGYGHVRTLGNVEGGWKGEDREARMYVLRKEGEGPPAGKKKRAEDSSSDEDG